MGFVYTVMLQDDFDWGYVNKNKKDVLKEIQDEFEAKGRLHPTLLGEWYGFMVLDLDKTAPEYSPFREILLRHADSVHFWHDTNPYLIAKLERE
jgi:hypothetical protein